MGPRGATELLRIKPTTPAACTKKLGTREAEANYNEGDFNGRRPKATASGRSRQE